MRIPRPKSVKEVRSSVGSINYIRDWLPGISELMAPINELIKGKPRIIKWTNEHDDYLKQIKDLIINHMPLELPAPGKRVLISTDASDVAVGGVIWQEIEPYSLAGTPLNKRKVKPLSFYSRLHTETQRKWSTLQKKLYAILLILTESCLESYLLTRHLTIFTDHKNIAFLATAPEKNRIVKRWLPILSEFDFDIVHEPGEDNHCADMLSRNIVLDQNEETPSICSINIPDTLLSNYEIPPIDDDSDSDLEDIPSISSLSRHQDLPIFSSWFSKIRSEQQIAKNNNDSLFENAILDENTQIWKNNKNKILIPKSLKFVNRFPEKIHLIENCGSSYLISLQQEIETLSPNIWAKCFPSDIVELPSRSLLSLPLTFAKLQKKILKVLENLDYIVRLSLAKEKIPFCKFFD
ncbi:hypothetical protein P9112_007786 [Eukaryota sp. TZLM1-RC]